MAAGTRPGRAPIAICGTALRLPGGIHTTEHLWDALRHGRDMRGPVPESRYSMQGFDATNGSKGAIATRHGYFLDQDLACFDSSRFSLSAEEISKTDPQQRLLLEVVKECFESAGETDYRGQNVGCYVGTFGEDWLQSLSKEQQHSGGYVMSGAIDLMLANRISYENDLRGPSMVIKTGCSASLIALHEACRALQLHDCDGAIVAGSNLILGPTTTAAMTSEAILSPEGSCKSFDSKADGFARGEAVTAVYLQRLDRAVHRRLPIKAVIANTGVNSDGRSQSLLQPSAVAQSELMRKVHGDIGSDPARTAFVECHGTGTATGDPIEAQAVGDMFGDQGVYIGSVKPNLGHSEGASGLTSLMKSLVMLEKSMIVPNIKFTTPNPKIDFAKFKLQVPTKLIPWPRHRDLRIAINSFGIGGSNAHVVLEHPYSHLSCRTTVNRIKPTSPQLLLMSAGTKTSLQTLVQRHTEYAIVNPDALPDLAYTLGRRREQLRYRTFAVSAEHTISESAPPIRVPDVPPNITMVFSGQGAQWERMGCELLQQSLVFACAIRQMDQVLQSLPHPPEWSIADELRKSVGLGRVNRAELSQPLCTALQIALVSALHAGGVRPSAVVGHSSGEIAAAYAAGAVTMDTAITVAYYRGLVTKEQSLNGAMAAIGLSSEATAAFLKPGVVIACENSRSSTTIAGDADSVEEVLAAIKMKHGEAAGRRLKVDMAYHSPHMQGLSPGYKALMQAKWEKPPPRTAEQFTIPFFSSVSGDTITAVDSFSPDYWTANLTSRVRFSTAMANALRAQGSNILLEIGPHSTLAGPIRQICADLGFPCVYCPTLIRFANSTSSLLAAFGTLYQHGIDVKRDVLIPDGALLTDLPIYPWDHSATYWYESRVSKAWRLRAFGHHALLGLRVPDTTDAHPVWRVMLSVEDVPWLAGHQVKGDVVLPFAGYVAMAGEALRQVRRDDTGYVIRGMVVVTGVVLADDKPLEIVTSLRQIFRGDDGRPTADDRFDFTISSHTGSGWIHHCKGQVGPLIRGAEAVTAAPNAAPLPRHVVTKAWYGAMARTGIAYGPEFRRVTQLTASTTQMLARATIRVNPSANRSRRPIALHPTVIDASFQVGIAAMTKGLCREIDQVRVPVGVRVLEVGGHTTDFTCTASCEASTGELSIRGVGEDGRSCLRLSGMRLAALGGNDSNSATSPNADVHAAAVLDWVADYDFGDVPAMIKTPASGAQERRVIEEFALLCIADSLRRLGDLTPTHPFQAKYRAWLERIVREAMAGEHPVLGNAKALVVLNVEDRLREMDRLREEAFALPLVVPFAKGLQRIYENIEAIFTGRVDTLELLTRDNTLTTIYNVVSFDYSDYISTLSNSVPTVRILEVGAGTGATTELILRGLRQHSGSLQHPRYGQYTFTDLSAGFFPKAQERFAGAPNMDFKVLDISRDPVAQGFEPASYDLILAANVVHATPELVATLTHLFTLLAPGGRLMLTEFSTRFHAPGYIFGNFSGWWLGAADGREWEPFVNVERWDRNLRAAGFTGPINSVLDAEQPWQYCATIVAQRSARVEEDDEEANVRTTDVVNILCETREAHVNHVLAERLAEAGFNPRFVIAPADMSSITGDCIATYDVEEGKVEEGLLDPGVGPEKLYLFQDLCRNLGAHRLLWLMPPTQVRCSSDLRGGPSLGLIRTARSELELAMTTLEIDPRSSNFAALVCKVFEKVRCRDNESLAPDREFVVDDGIVKVGRYRPFRVHDTVIHGVPSSRGNDLSRPSAPSFQLKNPQEKLAGTNPERLLEIPNDHVEIEVRAVGSPPTSSHVNGDYMRKHGALDQGLSGIVRRVGKNVESLRCYDRVFALSRESSPTTSVVILDASLAVKIPQSLGFDAAATVFACFATAILALEDVGRLGRGHSVLINHAVSAVGQASIRVAKTLGADIFATCKSKAESTYLIEEFGLPPDRVFSFEEGAFVSSVLQATDGAGVDLVLNTLSVQSLYGCWACVAEFGRLVEFEERDTSDLEMLSMQSSRANRSYMYIDIQQLLVEKPKWIGQVLRKCRDLYEDGRICPLPVYQTNGTSGAHSKAYIAEATCHQTPPISPATQIMHLDPQATYLLTGGLGGLGRAIAVWLAERGARHLLFLSPRAGTRCDDHKLFLELESMGCSPLAIQGAVQSTVDVRKCVHAARAPVKGVFHLAMQLRDALVLDMAYDDWAAVVAPKVDGARNLHEAFGDSLDFFVMTSSLSTVLYQPGQSNYNAANTFLEAFCQYRHSLKLPASVLNVCPIEGIGFVAENVEAQRKLRAQGHWFLNERALLETLELAILRSRPWMLHDSNSGVGTHEGWANPGHVVMGLRSEKELDDVSNRATWRRDRRMGSYHNLRARKLVLRSGDSSELKKFFARVQQQPDILGEMRSREYLAAEIGQKLLAFTMGSAEKNEREEEKVVDLWLSPMQLGLDSLVAIELQRWWVRMSGVEISLLEMMNAGSIASLGETAAAGLRKRLTECS